MTTNTSRRSVIKTAAWSAPVIVFGSAAPAVAASASGPGDILMQGNIQVITKTSASTASLQTPNFLNNNAILVYRSNEDSVSVTAMALQLILTQPHLTFVPANGQPDTGWTIPTSPMGTTVLNGQSAYIYQFDYDCTPAIVGSRVDYVPDGQPGTYGSLAQVATTFEVEVASGGEGFKDNDPFQAILVATIDGQQVTRSSSVGSIPDPADNPDAKAVNSDNMNIGDSID